MKGVKVFDFCCVEKVAWKNSISENYDFWSLFLSPPFPYFIFLMTRTQIIHVGKLLFWGGGGIKTITMSHL